MGIPERYRFKVELRTPAVLLDGCADVLTHGQDKSAKEAETFLRMFISESAKRGGQLKVKLLEKIGK